MPSISLPFSVLPLSLSTRTDEAPKPSNLHESTSKSELSEVLRKLGVLSLKVLDIGIIEFKVGQFSWNFSGDTYPEDERIQGRHGGYDPSTYQ
ncbi:hypothetical protein ACFX2B_031266 [Malus domestica]